MADWTNNLSEAQIVAALMRATSNPAQLGIQRINERPTELSDHGVTIETGNGEELTSMCFWLCCANALGVEPSNLISMMGITQSNPASDEEIHSFCNIFSVRLIVRSPDETREYGSQFGDQEIRLWLEHGHYKRIIS